MNIADDIKKIIIEKTASLNRQDLLRKPLVGFSQADDIQYDQLKEKIGDWHLNPAELLKDAKTVISYFVPFTKDVAADPKKNSGGSALWGEAYAVINPYFDEINSSIIEYLNNMGYSAAAIKATHTFDPKDMQSMWSHRSAAAIAGMGKFGANRLVITEKGSAGRFCTVLTSAVIHKELNQVEERCLYNRNRTCGLCFEICPVHALMSNSFNKFACQYVCNTNQIQDKHGSDTCGKCISVCPLAYIE